VLKGHLDDKVADRLGGVSRRHVDGATWQHLPLKLARSSTAAVCSNCGPLRLLAAGQYGTFLVMLHIMHALPLA
jgi:hypothetical protein